MIGSEKVDAVWKTVDKQQQFWQKKCQNIMGEGGKKVKWEKIRKPKNIWYQQSVKSVQLFYTIDFKSYCTLKKIEFSRKKR